MADLRAGILRVFDGSPHNGGAYCGSAFLIGDRYAVTCKHVISAVSAGNIYLLGGGAWSGGGVRTVRQVEVHPDRDVAVLELAKATDLPVFLPLADPLLTLSNGDELVLAGCTAPDRSVETPHLAVSGYDGSHDLELTDATIQKGMSGGPALLNGEVVGITQAKEDAHALIIPLVAFFDFVKDFAGRFSSHAHFAPIRPSELEELRAVLGHPNISEVECAPLFATVAPDSRPPTLIPGRSVFWSYVEFLAQKPHRTSTDAPLPAFLLLGRERITQHLSDDEMGGIEVWCEGVAQRLSLDLSLVTKAVEQESSEEGAKDAVLTVIVEPRDYVDRKNFQLRAWLWTTEPERCETPEEPVPREDLEATICEMIRATFRRLGSSADGLLVELAIPFSLFAWNANRMMLKAGPRDTPVGNLCGVAFRSWERIYHRNYDTVRFHWFNRWKDAVALSANERHSNVEDVATIDACCNALHTRLKKKNSDSIWGFVAHFPITTAVDVDLVEQLFGTALAAGLPVAFWPFKAITCDKGLAALVARLFAIEQRDQLPASVKRLRDNQPEPWNDIAMLWDNPDRLPPDTGYSLVNP